MGRGETVVKKDCHRHRRCHRPNDYRGGSPPCSSVRAAAEPATPSLAQANIEAERVSLDELFRGNERRMRDAVDARAKFNQPINAAENTGEISGKATPSEERLLHNLPPKKVQEEPLAY